MREAMKVRRLLMNGLKDKLDAVNDLTMVQGDSTLQSKSVVHSSLRASYTPVQDVRTPQYKSLIHPSLNAPCTPVNEVSTLQSIVIVVLLLSYPYSKPWQKRKSKKPKGDQGRQTVTAVAARRPRL